MDKNNSVDEFLGNVSDEFTPNKDPFELDTIEPQEEKEEVKEEEKPLPFHKDPKVLRFIEKEIAKRAPKESEETTFKKEVNNDEDDFLVRLIGNDTPEKVAMVREYKAREERIKQEAEERAFSRLSKTQKEAIEAERKASEQLDNSLEDIEENYNVDITSNNPVARKTRVDFMNFVEKIAPKDKNGNIVDYPDMNSAFETFQEMRKTAPVTNRAKDLASRSMARSGDSVAKPQERATFDNVDNFISNLLGRN